MKRFMGKDFLLDTDVAKRLYGDGASTMPIIDYHCHVDPRAIAEDMQFSNITQLWLGGDHYKWRLMRWCGVEESKITGTASDKDKFMAFASCLPKAIGNPIYHWTHMELQKYFDCHDVLDEHSGEHIWNLCNDKLQNGYSVRDMIRESNVVALCTTDDPIDDLRWHKQIADDKNFHTEVYPSFRPDKALAIEKTGYAEYIQALEEASSVSIKSYSDLMSALVRRLDYFSAMGCRTADHGLNAIPWNESHVDAASAFAKAIAGDPLTDSEVQSFQASALMQLGREYAKRDIVMQLHYGVQRNINPARFRTLGPDTGFDCIDTPNCSHNLAALLGAMADGNTLPKTILYSLNPSDNAMLACVAGAFQKEGLAGWVQHGSAWWFNDTRNGMEAQLSTLADLGVLGAFVGMLTDSRSFTSYVRHDYFRRVLCRLIGRWVADGEYPASYNRLTELVKDIAFNNVNEYFAINIIN